MSRRLPDCVIDTVWVCLLFCMLGTMFWLAFSGKADEAYWIAIVWPVFWLGVLVGMDFHVYVLAEESYAWRVRGMGIRRYFGYLWYLLWHKWYVLLECWRMHEPLRGLVHDFDKLYPRRFVAYARHFYAPDGRARIPHRGGYYFGADSTVDREFGRAAWRHVAENDHHWQWWLLVVSKVDIRPQPMSLGAQREMLADWMGAGRAQGGSVRDWYATYGPSLVLHAETRRWIEKKLGLRVR